MGLVEGDPEGAKYLSAFQEALRDLGWRDGQNVQIDFRATAEDPLQMAKLADALPLERTASRRIVSNDPYE